MNRRRLLFIDTETTGLNAQKHEIIEIAWILTDAGANILEKFEARMMPQRIEDAEPRALEVNGYTKEAWEKSPLISHAEAAKKLRAVASDCILVGQNVSFDEGFITALLLQNNLVPSWHYHKVDTATLMWPAFSSGDLQGLSLDKICAFLGIPQEKKHAAAADVMSCFNVYNAVMAKYVPLFPKRK